MKEAPPRREVDPRRNPSGMPAWKDDDSRQITRSVLSDQVSKVIINGVLSGRFQSGARLVESELAAMLGVSRSPIREALTELAQSGVVEWSPGRGCRIRQWSLTDLEELFAVRGLLEGYAARLAAARFTRDDEVHLTRIMNSMDTAANRSDYAQMIDLDLEFHFALWKCAGNQMLLRVLEGLSQQFRLFLTLNWKFRGGLQDVSGLHKTVVEALVSGDAARAEQAIQLHVRAESVVETLRQRDQQDNIQVERPPRRKARR